MKKGFYQAAMQESPISYACCKMICDEAGEPADFEFIEVNPAFARMFSINEAELAGKAFSQAFPELYTAKPEWLQMAGEIALRKSRTEIAPMEIDRYFDPFEKWIRVKIFSPENYYFIIYLMDISAEKGRSDEFGVLPAAAGGHPASGGQHDAGQEGRGGEDIVWERRLLEIADLLKQENEQQFQRIIESLPIALSIAGIDGMILYANPKCRELFELQEDEPGSATILDFWAEPAERDRWAEALAKENVVNDLEMNLKTRSGKQFWAIGSGITIQYQDRSCVLSAHMDITERKRMESALKISEEKYRLLTEFTSDVIWVLDLKKQTFSYISPSIYYLTGYTAEESMGQKFTDTLTPESAMIVTEAFRSHLEDFIADPDNQKSHILEIRQNCKNGDVIWVEVSTKYRFKDAGEIEIVGVSRNIEERKRAEREVLYLSYHDQLTGLYNRRFYEEELERINFRRNMPLTMVIGDVNGLKLTNDAFGHFAGDELLKKLAGILKEELKAEDMAARIGGDEFVLLLPNRDSHTAELLINRVKEKIRRRNSGNAILSVSFGWATKETTEEDFDSLFIQAEDMMYHSKLVESSNMKSETIRLAMKKLYQRNAMEKLHSERVGRLCKEFGKALGWTRSGDLWELELLGRMHDIGKIGIQEEILNKVVKLNDMDWIEIKRHPEVGYQILRTADEYVRIAEFVLSHHERADGNGYPRGLELDEIPIQARILAISEAYDVMVQGSIYRDSREEQDAVRELLNQAGKQFDDKLIGVFIEKVLKRKDLNAAEVLKSKDLNAAEAPENKAGNAAKET